MLRRRDVFELSSLRQSPLGLPLAFHKTKRVSSSSLLTR